MLSVVEILTPKKPTVAIAFLKRAKDIGRAKFQAELEMFDDEFVATVKAYCTAVMCWQNPDLAESINYVPSQIGDSTNVWC